MPSLAQSGWSMISWSGPTDALPVGWQVCDGSNGTPDLRNLFVVGAGDVYEVGDTGGEDSLSIEHTHSIALADLAHTHSIPSHTHTIASADLSHTHGIPSHTHSISTVDIDHEHLIASHTHNITSDSHSHSLLQVATLTNRAEGRPIGVWSSDGYLHVAPAESGTYSYYIVDDATNTYTHSHGGVTASSGAYWSGDMSSNATHNHGGSTGSYSGTSGAMSANSTHNHGGSTGSYSGTSGAMSANSTHDHGGATGSALADALDNRPPYYALTYLCAASLPELSEISTTPPYTFTISSGVVIEVPRSFTYGDIIIIALLVFLALVIIGSLFWIVISRGK